MTNKSISLAVLSIFALVLTLGFMSAALDIDGVSPLNINVDQGEEAEITFNLLNTDLTENITGINLEVDAPAGSWSFSPSVISLLENDTVSDSITLSADISLDANATAFSGTITINASGTETTGDTVWDSENIFVNVHDVTAPEIELEGDNPQYIAKGDSYVELGATAEDETDGEWDLEEYNINSDDVDTSEVGTYTVNYTAMDNEGNIGYKTRTVEVVENFCDSGTNSTDLDLDVDISNEGQGDDDTWNFLDTIEVEVVFENNKDSDDETYNLEDVTFELELLDANGHDVQDDLIWLSEDDAVYEDGDVEEGDDAEHIFKFRVNPTEIDEGDYDLRIKVYGDDDNNDEACISSTSDLSANTYEEISIEAADDEEEAVFVDIFKEGLEDLTTSCNSGVNLQLDVWNIGAENYEDIIVNLYNEDLGIDMNKSLYGELDAGDNPQSVLFEFDVSDGMDMVGNHYLTLTPYYYEEDDNDLITGEARDLSLEVSGNCYVPQANVLEETVELIADGDIKEEDTFNVSLEVENTGSQETTYNVEVSDYIKWASNPKIDNDTFTLDSGESKTILVTLTVRDNVEGNQTFDIVFYGENDESNAKVALTQAVQVPVAEKKLFNNLDFGFLDDVEGVMVPLLIALIVIIAVIIIVLLVKRKKDSEEDEPEEKEKSFEAVKGKKEEKKKPSKKKTPSKK